MENLISAWGWIYVGGFACYALMVLLVIPFSIKDLIYLFKKLSAVNGDEKPSSE